MSFHWQTEEDDSLWSEQTPASPPEQPGRFRNLPLLVILFGVLVLGGWAIYEQVTGRIAARSAQIEVDIQSSATVLHEAARQGDTELFTTLLSGRDAAWTEAQQELVAKGLFHDRTPLGLTASDDFRLQLTEIDVAADFLSVVVTFTLPMMSSPPGQPAQTVLLERAEVYRLGSDRWLLAPPEDSFWGEQRSVTGQRLSVTFPERDTIIGERLAADLDDHVAQFCERAAQENTTVACAPEFAIALSLSSDPASLAQLANPAAMLRLGDSLVLPTLTLVGLPASEEGYQALLRGYGRAVLRAAMNALTGYVCCDNGQYYGLLQRRLLAELGLDFWPVTEARYRELFQEETSLVQLTGSQLSTWAAVPDVTVPPEKLLDAMTLIAFVEAGQDRLGVLDLMVLLRRSNRLSSWLNAALPDYVAHGESLIAGQWRRFLFEQADLGLAEPPFPMQTSALELLCRAGPQQDLYGYDLLTGKTDRLLRNQVVLQALSLPSADELIISGLRAGEDGLEAQLWRWGSGEEQRLYGDPAAQGLYALLLDRSGRYLPFVALSGGEDEMPAARLLELDTCQEGDCRVSDIPGVPFWSASGARTALIGFDGRLFVGDERGSQPAELPALELTNFALAWIGDESIVFPAGRSSERGMATDLVRLDVDTGVRTVIVPASDYLALLPAEVNPESVFVEFLASAPTRPDDLYVLLRTTSPPGRGQVHLLRLSVNTSEIDLVITAPGGSAGNGAYPPFDFSPDGTWLTLGINYGFREPELYLVNVLTEEIFNTTVPSLLGYAWSPDSSWLVVSEAFQVRLVAPASRAEWLSVHGLPSCTFVRFSH